MEQNKIMEAMGKMDEDLLLKYVTEIMDSLKKTEVLESQVKIILGILIRLSSSVKDSMPIETRDYINRALTEITRNMKS